MWAHLSLTWPFKNYCEILFTCFKLFEFRVQVLGFLKSIAEVPIQSSCGKNILWNCCEFSFFVWEHIALIYYVIWDWSLFLAGVEFWVFFYLCFLHFFFVTFLVTTIMSVKLGNLRTCTKLGSLCTLHRLLSNAGLWVRKRVSQNTSKHPLSLHSSLVLGYSLRLWLKSLVWVHSCLQGEEREGLSECKCAAGGRRVGVLGLSDKNDRESV